MNELLEQVISEAEAAKKTSALKPSKKIAHIEAAFDADVELKTKMIAEIERLRFAEVYLLKEIDSLQKDLVALKKRGFSHGK